MRGALSGIVFTFSLFEVPCIAAKKYCWYFEGGYPIYFICRSYEDCCGTRCCVRALSIQRVWYFWLLLMLGIVFCCGAGYCIRRRMYPAPLPEESDFNVSFTSYPITAPGLQQPGLQGSGDTGGAIIAPFYPLQTHSHSHPLSTHLTSVYPPLPSYYDQPPPSYEKVLQDSEKK